MTFWTNENLKTALRDEKLVVPFDPRYIEQAAYELGISAEYAVTEADGEGRRHVVEPGDFIRIPSGQFALLLTEEIIRVPDRALAFISVKASWKLRGLVNISGFHADPGFHGRLKFSVYNASGQTIDITPGRRVFLIWFNNLAEAIPEDKLYRGQHQAQEGIRDDDLQAIRGMVASPAGLSTRITTLGDRLSAEVTKIETALTKIIDNAKTELSKEITAKNHDLALKIGSIGTQQKTQWWAIATVLLAGLLLPQLRDCLKKEDKGATSTSQAQPTTTGSAAVAPLTPPSSASASASGSVSAPGGRASGSGPSLGNASNVAPVAIDAGPP